MEEKKKDSKGLVAIAIVLLLVCLGMGCYIGYNKFLNKNNGKVETTKIDNSKSDKEDNNCKENSYQVLALSPIGGHAVLYNGEVYVNVYDSTPNIDDTYGDGKYQTLVKTRNNYKEYDFGELKMSIDSTNKWMKINIENVKLLHNNDYGQALSSTNPRYGVLMINSDNTVSYISTKDLIEGKADTTKLNVTDITDIKSEDHGGIHTYLVKSDGTKIDVDTIIK